MRIIKAVGPKELRIVDKDTPVPREGEVLVAVRACGICGSDKWYWKVEGPTDYIAGHEVAGEVISLGKGANRLKIGDRVAINNVKGCGVFEECRTGSFVRCLHSITHMGQGFSEFVVAPEDNCLILDDKISYEEGSLIFDNWGTPFAAIERAGVKAGDTVVVSGCGPIGLGAVVLSKLFGAKVIAVDPVEERRKAAVRLGAEQSLSPDSEAINVIRERTVRIGADIWLECSGKSQAYELAFSSIRVGGTLVSIGEGAKFEINCSEMLINKHLNFLGTLYSTMEQGRKIQELMVKGLIDPLCFVTNKYLMEDIPKVFGDVVDCKGGILKTILVIPEK